MYILITTMQSKKDVAQQIIFNCVVSRKNTEDNIPQSLVWMRLTFHCSNQNSEKGTKGRNHWIRCSQLNLKYKMSTKDKRETHKCILKSAKLQTGIDTIL